MSQNNSKKTRPLIVIGIAAYMLFIVFAVLFFYVSIIVTGPKVIAVALLATAILFFVTEPLRRRLHEGRRLLGRHPSAAVALFGLVALLINASLGTFVHSPIPSIRDEFSYLLTADTFSNGRLSNDTHPLWEHFRAGHVLHQPTYQSKYPPAQSAVLAFGQVVFGSPAVGVWLSLAVGCAALLWMLQAWLPARWALLGAFLFLVNFEVFLQWGQSFWGGAVALTGGAFVFGALPRLIREPRVVTAVVLSLGVLILAFARPLEGLLACIPVFVLLLIWMLRGNSPPMAVLMRTLIAPSLIVGVVGTVLMAQYNYAVTGDPLRMPYQVWLEQQSIDVTGALTGAIHSKGGTMPDYPAAVNATSPGTLSERMAREHDARKPFAKLVRQYHFFVALVLAIPLLFVPLAMRKRWLQFALLTSAGVFAGVFLNGAAGFPHYLAPIACLIVLLLMQGTRYLNAFRSKNRRTGQLFVQILPIFAVCVAVASITMKWAIAPVPEILLWSTERAAMQKTLTATGQRHLVIARYSPAHFYGEEWTYNDADIDNSPVVWARELTPEKNRQLLEYFADRQIWLLDADAGTDRKLVPYVAMAPEPRPPATKQQALREASGGR